MAVDGVEHGRTPKTLELPVGRHTVVLTRDGASVTRTIDVVEGQRASLCWDFRSEGPCPR